MTNPTHNPVADPLLTKIGVARALRSMAAIAAGIHEPDRALLWCEAQGFLTGSGKRGPDGTVELVLTQRGASAVWLFWKAYDRARAADRGEKVDLSEWQGPGKGDGQVVIE